MTICLFYGMFPVFIKFDWEIFSKLLSRCTTRMIKLCDCNIL